MIDLKRYNKIYFKDPPASELLSWEVLVSPSIVLTKDNSFLKLYEFIGIDKDGLTETNIDSFAALVEKSLKQLDENFTVGFFVVRKKTKEYLESVFKNETARFIDQARKRDYLLTPKFINHLYFSITYAKKLDKTDKLFNLFIEHDKKKAIKKLFSEKEVKKITDEEINSAISMLEDKSKGVVDVMDVLKFKELKDEELLGSLYFLFNPAEEKRQKINLPHYVLLDQYLTDFDLDSSYEDVMIIGKNLYRTISINEFPVTSWPGALDDMLTLPCELKASFQFKFLDKFEAKKAMVSRRRHYFVTRKSFVGMATESVGQGKQQLEDTSKLVYVDDAASSMNELESRPFGQFCAFFTAFGKDEEELEAGSSLIEKTMKNAGFQVIRETMHKIGAYYSSLPANAKLLLRDFMISLGNFADYAPVRTILPGVARNEHLNAPSLLVLDTEYKTPYYFNLHVKDVGHTVLFGPTGSGKSIFLNFIAEQYMKYNPKVFIFDKGYSSEISCKASAGKHIDFNPNIPSGLNPVKYIKTEQDKNFLKNFIETLITSYDYKMTDDDAKSLFYCIEMVSRLSEKNHTLATIEAGLPVNLSSKLRPWTTGEFKNIFANQTDNLSLSDYTVFETENLSSLSNLVMPPLLEYLFYRIDKAIDGIRPTLIILDEAWAYLKVPVFAEKVREWLKVLRKRNAVVILATQSLADVADSRDILYTVLDTVPTRIFLPNPKANNELMKDLYINTFGLSESDYEKVVSGIPKKEYLIKQESFVRLGILRLPPSIIALLSSDDNSRLLAKKYFDKDDLQWYRKYIEAWKAGETA